MRTRTRSSPAVLRHLAWKQTVLCNGTIIGRIESPWYIRDIEETMVDVVTPNFKKRSSNGQIFINPMTKTTVKTSGVRSGLWKRTRIAACSGTTVKAYEQDAYIGVPVKALVDDAAVSAAVETARALAGTAAQASIKEPEILGLAELAEIGKTFRMLRHPVENFNTFLKKIKRSRKYRTWKKTASRADSLASFLAAEWLRYRYGITPLLSTINTLVDDLQTSIVEPTRSTARGFSSTAVQADPSSSVYSNADCTWRETYTDEVQISARAGILYQAKITGLDKYGFSFGQVPATAFELTTLSFVLDWFWNIGDYIGALTPKVGVQVLGSWTTVTTVRKQTAKMHEFAPVQVTEWITTDSRYFEVSRETTTKSRKPGVEVSLANRWTTIDFSKSIHRKHLLDALALSKQLLFSR